MVHQQSGLLFLLLCWIAVKAENPPSISTLTKSPTNFKDGDTITLHCQASATGSSTFTYQWFATDFEGNGKDISLSRYSHQVNTGRLTIRSLNHTQDDGYFYCVAKNTAGRVRSKRLLIQVAHLEVTPNVDTSVSKSALQGAELTYEYPVVQSFPEPTITWTKGGSALSESERISLSASGNLYIGNVEVNDVDRYRSTVQNTYTGQSFSRGPVVVSVTARNPSAILSTPYIILGPTNQVAIQGKTSSVTFECFASGRPMPTISWRRGGQQIYSQAGKFTLTAHNKRLTVHNPRKSEEGVYECRVTTTNQHKSRTANLTIIVEPTFTVQPAMANSFPQESAMFKCNATGTPTPKITWFHNGQKVTPSTTGRIQINSKNELKFTSLQSGDKGTVQCVATNDAGEAMSKALLSVKPLPVWIDIPPKNTDAVVNETVELECKGRGDPTPSITWQKNDLNIDFSQNPRYYQKNTGSLQISTSQKSDSGKYTCVATNSAGSKRANATLRVLIKTVITTPLPSQIQAIKGIDKLLPCAVTKDPNVAVKWHWTKDGSAVDVSRMKLQNDGTLRIITVQENDAGTYTCRVQSVAGNATTTGTLSVQETPLAPSTPVVSDIQTTSIRLSWYPPGYDGNSPIISYNVYAKKGSNSWVLHSDNINPSDRMSILVRNLAPHTQYQFHVRAVNRVGVGAPSGASGVIRTLIAAPSEAPQNVNGVPTSADSILVQWQIPPAETHNGPLRGFKIAYRLSGVAASSFIIRKIANSAATQGNIDGLVKWTMYEIKVLAYNDAGDGKYSNPITVTTAEGIPTAPPQEVKVINITTTSVYLEWKPPPQKQQNGRIKGYKLQAYKGSTPNNIVQRVADHDDTAAIQRGTLSGLEKFTQYNVVVVAYNGAGDSPRSDTKLIKTEEGVPDAPRSFTVSEIYADALKVSWGQPLKLNGLLTAYLVKNWRNDTLPSSGQIQRLSNSTLSHTVTGLRANTVYTVEVSAETRAGPGTSVKLVAKTTQSPVRPGTPHNLRVIESRARSVVLNFTPGSSGRAPILSYTVEYNNDSFYDPGSARWKTLMVISDAHLVWNLLPLELPHLKPYSNYRFRVIATNKVGSSNPSIPSDTIRTLETAPSRPPSNLTVTAIGKDFLELRWKIPPQDTWNSDYIGFNVTLEPQGAPRIFSILRVIPNSHVNHYRAGALLSYKHYKVSVRAYNLNGKVASKDSAVAWAWTKEDAPSAAPSSVVPEVTGPTSVLLKWGTVDNVGQNGRILGYKIYYRVFGRQNTEKEKEVINGLVFSTALTKLESYVTYEFQILAYTRIGNGPRSTPVRATTLASNPGPPARVRFTNVARTTATIAWDPPDYPRGVISRYRVACRLNESSSGYAWDETMDRNARQRIVGILGAQSFYRFFVWAGTNTSWTESPAEAVVYTGGSTEPPDAPFILPIYFSDISERWIIVKWQATSDTKSPLRYFTLQLNKNGEGWQVYSSNVPHTARSLKVEGLIPGGIYTFRIMATNDKGNSPYSAASTAVTTRLALPTGAPRDVRIQAASPTSLLMEWAAPSPQELGGTLKGFIVKHREQNAASNVFSEVRLNANTRRYALTRLKVFTVYEVKVAAENEKGPGPYTPVYRVTTGEKPPSEAPKNLRAGAVTRKSIAISWVAPSQASFNGHLMGYKVYAKDLSLPDKRKRRRRRSIPVCLREPGPKLLFVPPYQTSANITNLRKFVKYRIWVRAYNSIGESPSSEVLVATTHADKPGPPAVFRHNAVYNARVDLSWKPPCEPNGEIIDYEIKYGITSTSTREKVVVGAEKEGIKVIELAMSTQYFFQVRARNSMGYGPPKSFVVKTKGPAVLPGRPGKPVVQPGSITAVIMWENGDSGNVPFEKFDIQSRTEDSTEFVTQWEANPDDTKKNQSYVYYTVGNLEPNTGYQFKIIAWNEVGASDPSEASDMVFTASADTPTGIFYTRWWFILLMVLFFLILILLIVGFAYICYRRRKQDAEQGSSTGVSTTHSTLEMMRNSRNGTIRSGTLPNVQITYRDTEPEEDVSSLGSKEELTDDSDSGVSEVTYKRKNDMTFVNHYANNANHMPWRNSLGRTRPTTDRNLIEHTTEESDAPDEVPMTRVLKSFSVTSLPRDHRDGPPAYDGRRYMAKSADQLDRIERYQLPPESVTSFMSPEYEQKQKRPAHRDRKDGSYPRSRASRPAGPLRRSRDQMDYNDDSSTPPQSPSRPTAGNFAYAPKTEIQNRNRTEPRSSSFRRALEFDPNPRDSDGSSKYSDRASSSSNDHRDTRTLVDPIGAPRIQYDEEPGRRRRPQLPNLQVPANKPSRHQTQASPSTPISPAPSYHTVDPAYNVSRVSPVPSYHSGSNRDTHSDHSDGGRNPPPRPPPSPVMYLDRGTGQNNDTFQSSEPHISNYSSFV